MLGSRWFLVMPARGAMAALLLCYLIRRMQKPIIATQTVPLDGSNALEFQAVLFALAQASINFPGQPFALFTDNRDAADRLQRAKIQGLVQDAELAQRLNQQGTTDAFAHASICWIKSHASCRGNTLADQHAAEAAR
jgi:ribonuclease HI